MSELTVFNTSETKAHWHRSHLSSHSWAIILSVKRHLRSPQDHSDRPSFRSPGKILSSSSINCALILSLLLKSGACHRPVTTYPKIVVHRIAHSFTDLLETDIGNSAWCGLNPFTSSQLCIQPGNHLCGSHSSKHEQGELNWLIIHATSGAPGVNRSGLWFSLTFILHLSLLALIHTRAKIWS